MTLNRQYCGRFRSILPVLLLSFLLAGCVAGQKSFDRGAQAFEQEDYDQAVAELLTAVEKNPGEPQFRLKLNQARNRAALEHKKSGDDFFDHQHYRDAIREYQLASELDKSLFAATDGLESARDYLQAGQLVDEAETLIQNSRFDQAREAVNQALSLVADYPPALKIKQKIKQSQFALVDGVELEVKSTQPINLNFRDTKIPDVFDILTRLSGINFILDEDIRNDKTTLFLEQATFAQALELLLRMNKLDKKILNSKTIILFPKTRDKQKQFEDQIIQTFYLSHIDAKKAVNLLRTMLQVRKIYVQEELNAIVIRDQPDVIKLAQKMIEANDRGSSEVVFDLELLEVNHSDTRELGLKLSNYSIGAGLSVENSGLIANSGLSAGGSTANLVDFTKNLDPFYSIPTAAFRFLKTLVNAEVLANPKIRVRNREKAKVHVGSREPVITVTINDTLTSENVQYIDVGVKLDVEPTIQLDKTIVTKLGLEVSNVSGREKTNNGTAVITISSTNADTTLTLRDGEQTIIGGLIRNDNSSTKNKIPLLGDIPLVGEIFNGTDHSKIKREILLSITPHIVKFVSVPQGDTASIWSGGEDDLKFGRNFGTFADEYANGQGGIQDGATAAPEVDGQGTEGQSPHSISPERVNSAENAVVGSPVSEVTPVTDSASARLFVTGPKNVALHERFELDIQVNDISSLYSAPFQIQYDAAAFKLIEVSEGAFLGQDNIPTLFTYANMADTGRASIGLKRQTGEAGVSGNGVLAKLVFEAVSSGESSIEVARPNFRSENGKSLNVETHGLTVKVTADSDHD